MDGLQILFGMVTLEITSADTAGFLTALAQSNIPVFHVEETGPLTILMQIRRSDFKQMKLLCAQKGDSARLKRRTGIYWNLKRIIKRPVLLMGIGFVVFLCLYLPTKILFVEISGNQSIPTKSILETAQACGINFGASRAIIRSEQMKNKLLANMPQLQWAGINTYGCRAVISVSEKDQYKQTPTKDGVCSIIAATDGVIASCTATKGTLLCAKGQAVKRGEVLISGYTDCGIIIRAERAQGEIFANTLHNVSLVVPLDYKEKNEMPVSGQNISLILGKFRINLSDNSGILTRKCDKICQEYPLSLPGGFNIPVTLVIEHWKGYNTEGVQTVSVDVPVDASHEAQEYLKMQMISGTVLSKAEIGDTVNDAYFLHGQYACHEMIGRIQNEEIIDGKDH